MHNLRVYMIAILAFIALVAVAVKGDDIDEPAEGEPEFKAKIYTTHGDLSLSMDHVEPMSGLPPHSIVYNRFTHPARRKTVFDDIREMIIKEIRVDMVWCKNRILEAIRDLPEAPDAQSRAYRSLTQIDQCMDDFEYVMDSPYYQDYQDSGALMFIRERIAFDCADIIGSLKPPSKPPQDGIIDS